ncbi:putative mannitol dehydrogenase [Leptomonas pyrrhocoris]|uniref:mannitol 2-dehydrogenase n=1 Tax=Leptomonas pyrrhocoris TaxID=157538 RepID=A0A0M9G8E7_LEPPY|nr:putative mannitol dehydrogenase [Leptomonas pyrrhocoris]KPA84606.1 putative mannitol dehydrogenase [Leptomonas pyrrhocoris]|eukprot:XP_015663045.1 putative mannitol dehydrogenase [Leptomonas pyrrhocoris]
MPLQKSDASLAYDRRRITPGIVHFGVGQFCRGHLFRYTQHLLEVSAKENHQYDSWGIVGVNVIKGEREREMWQDFKKQDCMYSVTLCPTKGPHTTEIIGSMLDYVYAPEQHQKVLDYLADPRIRIVSLTVTEGGYNIDEVKNCFNLADKAVKADLANPAQPHTTFGYIVEGLRLRRERKIEPFTVMSCDNLRHNGDVAKKAILGYAGARDAELCRWIEANVCFPNSMVDRITPATTPAMRTHLNKLTGLDDLQPVIGEDFNQWVIENRFRVRPPWERVGQELTDNVAGYENTKVRILNSSHLMLTFSGLLLGYRMVHEALGDADIHRLVANSLENDVLPTLDSPMDKVAYKNKVLSRFMNPAIADQLLRIAGDGCSKVQVFWTNNVVALLKNKRDLSNFAFGLACFLAYLEGKDCKGATFPVIEPKLDPKWKELIASSNLSAPLSLNAFDSWRSLDHAELDAQIVHFRKLIKEKGVRAAMPFKNKSAQL